VSATIVGTIAGAPQVGSSGNYYFSMYRANSGTATFAGASPLTYTYVWDTIQNASPYISYNTTTGLITFVTAGRYLISLGFLLYNMTNSGSTAVTAYSKLIINGANSSSQFSGSAATSPQSSAYPGVMQLNMEAEFILAAGNTMYAAYTTYSGIPLTYNITNGLLGGLGSGSLSTIIYKGLY